MMRSSRQTSNGFGIFEMLFLVLIIAIIGICVLCGWFFFRSIQTNDESVRDSAQQEMSIEKAKLALQGEYFDQMTTCGKDDNRRPAQRVIAFHKYLKINGDADRAIMRGCKDVDYVFAKNNKGEWFPLFTFNADKKQDNAVRKACKIQDITSGFDDDTPENQQSIAAKKTSCNDIEASYQSYLRTLQKAERHEI